MSRTRALALVLVNWRGVFYERYLLDSNVTALEGPNGAGKTTVMVAAYLVLFPDLKRLRFTNLGETGATGGDKGIWGRLGEIGRPSYSALRVQLCDGSQVVVGVVIERKSQPHLALHPFVIENVPPEHQLSELFLVRGQTDDAVPSLDELRQNAEELGLRLRMSGSVKAYFQTLFTLGITPLRLSGEEERNKFNEMLRTSMTGGISRALTSELRSFLLKQEGALGDVLGRMRANLAACRRTRTEVQESRLVESEISGIFDAGQAMFRAAYGASQQQAQEQLRRLQQSTEEVERVQNELSELSLNADQIATRLARLRDQTNAEREEYQNAERRLLEIKRAQETVQQLDRLRQEMRVALETVNVKAEQHREASEHRELARKERDVTRAASTESARGLVDLQQGLDELHRRANAYRRAKRTLDAAVVQLGVESLQSSELGAHRLRIQSELEAIDQRRAERHRELSLGSRQRADYQRAQTALEALVALLPNGQALAGENDYQRAQDALRQHAQQEWLSSRVVSLNEDLQTSRQRHTQQRAAREAANKLDISEAQQTSHHINTMLAEAESQAKHLRQLVGQLEWENKQLQDECSSCCEQQTQLGQQHLVWLELSSKAKALPPDLLAQAAQDEAGLTDCITSLALQRQTLERKQQQLTQQRGELLAAANALESSSSPLDQELELLADEVNGDLLAHRYEALDIERAAEVEAELGPLVNAIVVDDVDAAAAQLSEKLSSPVSLWLIPHTALESAVPSAIGNARPEGDSDAPTLPPHTYLTPWGLRLMLPPSAPRLGRLARAQEVKRLRKEAMRISRVEEEVSEQLAACQEQRTRAELLQGQRAIWLAGSQEEALAELKARTEQLQQQLRSQREELQTLRKQANSKEDLVDQLRALLPLAPALEIPDQAQQLEHLERQLELAKQARRQAKIQGAAIEALRADVDALRLAPPGDGELAAWEAEQAALRERRAQLFQTEQLLTELIDSGSALDWSDAEQSLTESKQLAPELKAQQARAEQRADAAEQRLQEAEAAWELAIQGLHSARADLEALNAHGERARAELEASGLGEESPPSIAKAETQLNAVQQRLQQIEARERDAVAQDAVVKERIKQHTARLSEGQAENERAQAAAQPAQQRWQQLRERCRDLCAFMTIAHPDGAHSSSDLWPLARSRAALLLDRLRASASGGQLADELEAALQDASSEADPFVTAWRSVREWLQKCLPAQVANVQDPLEALARLRHDLDGLERRLAHQEGDLRGASEDVARSIEVQIRRAASQVRRLNHSLEGVSFGSVSSIRVRMDRVERMALVLEALREGAAQELLFESSLPIEQALDEIFRRYGGGRSGGQRILDYREYVELQVEVRRKSGQDWELANPTRVSTGEAIGVGAALMMVILSEWERSSKLLRPSDVTGTLRFLFLDEANRLSQDNLGVLFDLCQGLDLQLLIAAPEVARAEGNTTYRLVRKTADDGTEEVVVSGRRAHLPDASAAPSAEDAPRRASPLGAASPDDTEPSGQTSLSL